MSKLYKSQWLLNDMIPFFEIIFEVIILAGYQAVGDEPGWFWIFSKFDQLRSQRALLCQIVMNSEVQGKL